MTTVSELKDRLAEAREWLQIAENPALTKISQTAATLEIVEVVEDLTAIIAEMIQDLKEIRRIEEIGCHHQ